MRRKIDKFEIGWMNGKSNLTLNSTFINGIWIKTNEDWFCFNIEFDKENLIYKIFHSMKLKYPWCDTSTNLRCGKYTTQKGEKIAKRENEIKKIVLDWFIGMYGSEGLLKSYFGSNYETIKIKHDENFQKVWNKYFITTQNAMRKFAEDFCLSL